MRICFHIDSLRMGGAEFQLLQIAKGLADLGNKIDVVTLFPGGELWTNALEDPRLSLVSLYKSKASWQLFVGWQLLNAPRKLASILSATESDVLYSMLDMNNYTAARAHKLYGKGRLVWGLRGSEAEARWFIRLARYRNAKDSSGVDLIVANSTCGLAWYESFGYRAKKHLVIPNGIDTELFCPRPEARHDVRDKWGVASGSIVIGVVGNLRPAKGHATFIRAAESLIQQNPELRFVCVGRDSGSYAAQLKLMSSTAGLDSMLTWLGPATNMPEVYAGLDLLVSSSVTEGFSNVICEALSCGVPCVVTDVGDSALIVGDSDRVVPPDDSLALADCIAKVLSGRPDQPEELRSSVADRFSLQRLVETTNGALVQ